MDMERHPRLQNGRVAGMNAHGPLRGRGRKSDPDGVAAARALLHAPALEGRLHGAENITAGGAGLGRGHRGLDSLLRSFGCVHDGLWRRAEMHPA